MPSTQSTTIVLASTSQGRRRLLEGAGVSFTVVAPPVDETNLRTELAGHDPAAVSAELANVKANSVSRQIPDAVVVGGDQVLQVGGHILSKPAGRDEARSQLLHLRGKTHALHTAVCVAEAGRAIWQYQETAHLTMHGFSDSLLEAYLDQAGAALGAPGGYHLEGLGALLFDRVEGDLFAIVGLPLIPLLGFLRRRGALPS